jgi:chromosome segregation ATPase
MVTTKKQFFSPQESCQEVLQVLRSSDLIFLLQESPYSAYITIRKRFRKDAEPKETSIQREDVLHKTFENLKAQNETITVKFEETILESEELNKKVLEYENIMNILHTKLEKADKEN